MSSENNSSSGSKKKKVAAAAIAVALAAALMIGGTISYLVSSSSTIVNTFSTPTIDVNLVETTDGYTIIPGTSEEKDPTVKITTGVEAYVYLVVEDSTDGLVTYTINEAWTLLYTYDDSCPCYDSSSDCAEDSCECGFCDSDGGTVYVYYMKVDASSSRQSIDCLSDQTVYYSSAITNEDVEDYEDGNLTLSFTAYAIQAEPFYEEASDSDDEDAVAAAIEEGAEEAFPFAYYDINPEENVDGDVALVCTESKLDAALNDNSVAYIVMVADITSNDAVTVSSGSEVTLDLNGHTLYSSTSSSAAFTIKGDLTIADSSEDGDGTIDGNSYTAAGYSVFDVYSTGSLTIEGGTIKSFRVSNYTLISVGGSGGELTINGGSITSNTAMYIVKVGLASNSANATMTMTGGTISSNNVSCVVYAYGSFDMSGGSISSNTGTGAGVAIYACSGSTVALSGTASISGNSGTTGTVYVVSGSTLTLSDSASISSNTMSSGSGGVYVGGTFTMTGGSITGNSAGSSSKTGTVYGGGVYVASTGTFTMSGGTISNNAVTGANYAYGGGVGIQNGTFTMTGGSITGNSVTTSNSSGAKGGGVLVYGSSASVTLDSSLITNNTAVNTSSSTSSTDNINTVSSGTYTDTASTSE